MNTMNTMNPITSHFVAPLLASSLPITSITVPHQPNYIFPKSVKHGNGTFWITVAQGNQSVATKMSSSSNANSYDNIDININKMVSSLGNDCCIVSNANITLHTMDGNTGCYTIIQFPDGHLEFAKYESYTHADLLKALKTHAEAERMRRFANLQSRNTPDQACVKNANSAKNNASNSLIERLESVLKIEVDLRDKVKAMLNNKRN